MPKPTKGPRLGGSSSHQKALLANLATSLFEHGRIKTTEPKARALRPYAEKLITHAKKGTLHNRREVMKKIRDKDVVHTLFAEIGPFFADRNGGYTRIIKVEARKGDNAPMAVIELVREKTVTSEADRARRVGGGEEGRAGRARLRTAGCSRARGRRRPRGRRRGRGRGRQSTRPRPTRRPPRPRPRRSPTPRPRGCRRGRRRAMPTSPRRHDDERARHRLRWRARSSSASTSPTTERNSRAGRRRSGSARSQACSTRRCRRCSAPRCSCARRAAPTPACTPPARWRTSTCPADAHRRTPIRARRGRASRSSCRWCGGCRGCCPTDVRVLDIVRAPAGFDARFSALRRHYEYRLSTAPYGVEPQQARFVTAWPRPLDVDAMAAASRELVGLHDFAAFCRHREGATTIRDLQRLDWSRDGDLVTAHVTADAFCWSMVRSLVGALLAVGEGRREPAWCAESVDGDAAVQRLRGRARRRA